MFGKITSILKMEGYNNEPKAFSEEEGKEKQSL